MEYVNLLSQNGQPNQGCTLLSTLNSQLSTLNSQLSTLNSQLARNPMSHEAIHRIRINYDSYSRVISLNSGLFA